MPNNRPWPEWKLAPCGTPAAARRHYRRGEPLDYACLQANANAKSDDPWVTGPNAQPDPRPVRNGIPWKPYVYRGRGYDIYEDVAS